MTYSRKDHPSNDLAAGYVLEDLSAEEIDRLDQALTEDPEIAAEIASFQEAIALLPYDLPQIEPSTRLKEQIMRAASGSKTPEPIQTNVVPLTTSHQRNWKRWIPAISTSIAALAFVSLGLNQIQLSQQSRQTIALQQKLEVTNAELKRLQIELEANKSTVSLLSKPDMQMYSLVSVKSTTHQPTARLLSKPGDVSMTLVAQDLPQLPKSQIYRLWAVATPAVAPMYCGQFRQDDSGKAQWVAPNAACTKNPAQLLITLDAPNDPITSAGPLVMRSSI